MLMGAILLFTTTKQQSVYLVAFLFNNLFLIELLSIDEFQNKIDQPHTTKTQIDSKPQASLSEDVSPMGS